MKKPKVSTVILNWNTWEDTIECLENLKKTNYKKNRVWLLDNGSENDSVEKIEKYLKKSPKIKFLKQKKNLGFTGGNNFVIKEILKKENPDYILLLSSDVVVDKNFLDYLIKIMEENPDVGLVAPNIFSYYNPKIIQDGGAKKFKILAFEKREFKNVTEEEFPKKPFFTDIACACCWLIKKEVLEKNLLEESFFSYCEDDEFCLRIRKEGWNIMIHPLSKVWHKGGSSTKNLNKDFPLFYITRNSIWLRKKFGNAFTNLLFYLKFFLIDFPKTILYLLSKKRFSSIEIYLKSIKEGFKG